MRKRKTLKPCPFCGGKAAIKSHRWAGNAEVKAHYVQCTKCNANSRGRNTVEKTTEFWNTRAGHRANRISAAERRVVEAAKKWVNTYGPDPEPLNDLAEVTGELLAIENGNARRWQRLQRAKGDRK